MRDTISKPVQTGLKAAMTGIAVAASVTSLASCGSEPEQPNIIFIMSDDHTSQAISAFGSTLTTTPNIDRIAEEGALFNNSFVTNSICAPSRAVMLTGKYSHLNGKMDNRDTFDNTQETFPQILHEEGYATAMIGKWHLESTPVGFDTYQYLIDSGGQGVYYNPAFNEDGQSIRREGYVTDIITDKSIAFMEEAVENEQPFMLLMHQKAPHRNWMPGPDHLGEFEDVTFPVPDTFFDDYATREFAAEADMQVAGMYLSQDMKLLPEYYGGVETGTGGQATYAESAAAGWVAEYNRMTPEQKAAWDEVYLPINEEFAAADLEGEELAIWMYQRYMRDYLATAQSVDDSIGEVLDFLDENGLAENTIIVYTSDQGFYLGEHGWFDKRWMYEESFRMPLVMRYPAVIPAGEKIDDFVLNLDFAPTFLDLAHVEVPADMQGESLRDVIDGGSGPKEWRESVYYHYYEYPHGWHNVRRHFGVRTDRYKLINFYNERDWELYDLQEDPNELNNVYDDPAYADVVDELKDELDRLRLEYEDTTY